MGKAARMSKKTLERNFFQRLLGRCATPEPADSTCWKYVDSEITLFLSKTPELSEPGSGVRLEGEALPERLLVVHGTNGQFLAFRNRCGHGGRRMDPMPDQPNVQCCSLGKTTCDYEGKVLSGAARESLKAYPVEFQGDILIIQLSDHDA